MNILIVDDDEIARMSLAGVLRRLGTVEMAGDGQEAWEKLDAGLRPDICCCDIAMPRLDGLALVQRTREHPILRDLPFVLISAASDRRTVEAAVAGGVAGYLLKPFDARRASEAVARVVRERRAAECENVLATRRRLEVGSGKLRRLLDKLREDADGCASQLADENAGRESLQRLLSGTLVLGLWRGTALLKEVLAAAHDAARARLVVDEVRRLVQRQLGELGTAVAVSAA